MAWFVVSWLIYNHTQKGFISVAGTEQMGSGWGLNKKEKHPLMKAAILPLSYSGNGSVWYSSQCGWNTAAHSCISALYRNPDKSKRSNCHWNDVVRKHRDGICCGLCVCRAIMHHWDLQPWAGEHASTAGQHFFERCSVFALISVGNASYPHINLHNQNRVFFAVFEGWL